MKGKSTLRGGVTHCKCEWSSKQLLWPSQEPTRVARVWYTSPDTIMEGEQSPSWQHTPQLLIRRCGYCSFWTPQKKGSARYRPPAGHDVWDRRQKAPSDMLSVTTFLPGVTALTRQRCALQRFVPAFPTDQDSTMLRTGIPYQPCGWCPKLTVINGIKTLYLTIVCCSLDRARLLRLLAWFRCWPVTELSVWPTHGPPDLDISTSRLPMQVETHSPRLKCDPFPTSWAIQVAERWSVEQITSSVSAAINLHVLILFCLSLTNHQTPNYRAQDCCLCITDTKHEWETVWLHSFFSEIFWGANSCNILNCLFKIQKNSVTSLYKPFFSFLQVDAHFKRA